MTTSVKLYIASASSIMFFCFACKKNTTQPSTAATTTANTVPYDAGVFINCEGIKGSSSGSISFYNRSNKTVLNDIFQTVNGFPLGFIVKSLNIYNAKGYIVVSDAGKIEVVSAPDFKSIATINGFYFPRYFLPVNNNKAYVSDWGDMGLQGTVKIINLQNNTITATIPVGLGPEIMVKIKDLVYIACKGGKGNDSVVSIINSLTDMNLKPIMVGYNPGSMQIDANGKLWVLCGGLWNASYTALIKTGKLVRINPETNAVEQILQFTDTTSSPGNLCVNAAKTKLLYNFNGAVYSQNINDAYLNSTLFINKSFNALGIDPENDNIYGSVSGMNTGMVSRYTNSGVKIDSFPVGVAPGSFSFK